METEPVNKAQKETRTRETILSLVMEIGPVTVLEIAKQLSMTTAGVRRHVDLLLQQNKIRVFQTDLHTQRRGRPAKSYIAAGSAHDALGEGSYQELATQLLEYLSEINGVQHIEEFAERTFSEMAKRYGPNITGNTIPERVKQLVDELNADGYKSSVRPLNGLPVIQLCQGHCPVQHVAEKYPQFCDMETKAFADLLGIHTQRLATLAGGGHVCTMNVPITKV